MLHSPKIPYDGSSSSLSKERSVSRSEQEPPWLQESLLMVEKLKPRCVELSQLALRDDGSPSNAKYMIDSTKKLLDVLVGKCRRDDGAFDEKLADYVFFPLSQILRKKQQYND